jgi:putative membrane protein
VVSSALLSTLHLLGLTIGLSSVYARGRALRALARDPGRIEAVFFADNWWGVSAVLSIGTGLTRAFGSFEKGSGFYLNNHAFLVKLGLVGVLLLLELWPMVTLIRWRIAQARKQPFDTSSASALARVNTVEVALMLVIPFIASLMARGLGFTWFA